MQPWIDPDRLVFLDETGFTTKMTRLYGRCPIGERLVILVDAPVSSMNTSLSGSRSI